MNDAQADIRTAGIPPWSVARFQSRHTGRKRNYSLPVCGVFFSIDSIHWRVRVSCRISSIFTFGSIYAYNIKNVCIRHDGYYFILIPPPPYPITSRVRAILFLTGFSLLFFYAKKSVITKIDFFSFYMHTNWTRILFNNEFYPKALYSVNRFHFLNAYTTTNPVLFAVIKKIFLNYKPFEFNVFRSSNIYGERVYSKISRKFNPLLENGTCVSVREVTGFIPRNSRDFSSGLYGANRPSIIKPPNQFYTPNVVTEGTR